MHHPFYYYKKKKKVNYNFKRGTILGFYALPYK